MILRARRGDRNAWSSLVQSYRNTVQSLALRFLNSREDAQDVTQEVFVYAYLHLATLREPEAFGAWVREIVRRKAADFRRNRATRTYAPLPEDISDRLVDCRSPTEPNDLLTDLPPGIRWTAQLAFSHGYSLLEIAAVERIPVNTVRSRLARARTLLRSSLGLPSPDRNRKNFTHIMSKKTTENSLPTELAEILYKTLPNATLLSAIKQPEPWMPFEYRVRIKTASGLERSLDFRWDITDKEVSLLNTLARLGLPVPRLVAGPVPSESDPSKSRAITETPVGENLLLWALEGNVPTRVRAATTLGIDAIDRLHALTESLSAEPIANSLPRRGLSVEVAEIRQIGGPWLEHPLFAEVLARLEPRVAEIDDPLVFTNDLYFPNFLRVTDGQVTEFVYPWGHFGDPLLGLAKFWTYDCYPFLHTGFVERYLYEMGYSRRDFAPRLAVRALRTLQNEVPITRLEDGSGEYYWESVDYYNALTGYLRQALPDL